MALFVHLTPEKNIKSIKRNGIKLSGNKNFGQCGVYAMPVIQNFYVSHQWLRELKRWGQRAFVGVYFRVPDDELVWIGHYNQEQLQITAAEAIATIMKADHPLGYEIIIPRTIQIEEIHRIRNIPQVLGWRYFPEAHGKAPCVCLCCERGQYGIRKLEKAVKKAEAKNKPSKIIMFGRDY